MPSASSYYRYSRKMLWHLRHGNVDVVAESVRRNLHTHTRRIVSRTTASIRARSIPPWTCDFLSSKHDIHVGVICDDFTRLCFEPEWRALYLLPDTWQEQLADTPIDFLFVESCWHGNQDTWQYKVIGEKGPSETLENLVAYCRSKEIPTVFWNKEDPVHFDECIRTAALFDWVYTTDADMLEKYHEHLGHDNVGVLSFAAQPAIHNPLKVMRKGKAVERSGFAFGGMYFRHKYPERAEQMDILLSAAGRAASKEECAFDIFARFQDVDENYRYPDKFRKHIRGALSYEQMLSAYRMYSAFLNVNSVVDSTSMCARRVFEILSCGTPVVSMPTPALEALFDSDMLSLVTDTETAYQTLRALQKNSMLGEMMSDRARDYIMRNHTYTHRVDMILEDIGLAEKKSAEPTVAPLVSTIRPQQIEHILKTLARQKDVSLQPFIATHGFAPTDADCALAKELGLDITWIEMDSSLTLGEIYNQLIARADTEYIAKMDDDDLYSSTYLYDSVSTADFSRADIVGKHSYFAYLKSKDITVLRFPHRDFRATDFLAGPTIVARSECARSVSFPKGNTGEDSGFLRSASQCGARIVSGSPFGFVLMRGASPRHTWSVSDAEILAASSVSHKGLPNQSEFPRCDDEDWLEAL